eukprot:6468233-Alexandrium_andersonii.AAC.1
MLGNHPRTADADEDADRSSSPANCSSAAASALKTCKQHVMRRCVRQCDIVTVNERNACTTRVQTTVTLSERKLVG